MVYRLRNYADLKASIEEMSAVCDKQTILKLYRLATDPAFSFLYLNLDARKKEDMFYMGFSHKLIPQE